MNAPARVNAESLGAFGASARTLYEIGLAPIPCPGDDGKSPAGAVKGFGKWCRRPPPDWLEKMIERWPHTNVGIITRFSNKTVVDVDRPRDGTSIAALVEAMLERFGSTPLISETPSGGRHLWYQRSSDRDFLRLDGMAVDVRSDGVIIVPPSVRLGGEFTGRPYRFISGGWSDLDRLTHIRPGALTAAHSANAALTPLRSVTEGRRNDTLFKLALFEARYVDDADTHLDKVRTINDGFLPPLDDTEVVRVARSAWDYQRRGLNWSGKQARVTVTRERVDVMAADPDAFMLLLKLQLKYGAHCARGEAFPASPEWLARDDFMGTGWGHGKYRDCLRRLVDRSELIVIETGGRKPGDPRLYRLGPTHVLKATETGGIVTRHPAPAAAAPLRLAGGGSR